MSVTRDSFDQLHVRLRYRINGMQLPEGTNVFGQVLYCKPGWQSVSLITVASCLRSTASALPAESLDSVQVI